MKYVLIALALFAANVNAEEGPNAEHLATLTCKMGSQQELCNKSIHLIANTAYNQGILVGMCKAGVQEACTSLVNLKHFESDTAYFSTNGN